MTWHLLEENACLVAELQRGAGHLGRAQLHKRVAPLAVHAHAAHRVHARRQVPRERCLRSIRTLGSISELGKLQGLTLLCVHARQQLAQVRCLHRFLRWFQ